MYHVTAVGRAVGAGGAQSGTQSVVLGGFRHSPSSVLAAEACGPIRGKIVGGRVAARGQAAKSMRRSSPRDLDGRYRR